MHFFLFLRAYGPYKGYIYFVLIRLEIIVPFSRNWWFYLSVIIYEIEQRKTVSTIGLLPDPIGKLQICFTLAFA